MREVNVEAVLTLGVGAAIFAVGAAVGQLVVDENQASAAEIASARERAGAVLAEYDALTEDGSCERHVLGTFAVTGFSGGNGDAEDAFRTSLVSVCGELTDEDLPANAAQNAQTVIEANKELSFLQESAESNPAQRVVAGLLGGTVFLVSSWGVYTSVLRG